MKHILLAPHRLLKQNFEAHNFCDLTVSQNKHRETSSKKARFDFSSDEELQLFTDDIESEFSDSDTSSDDSGI